MRSLVMGRLGLFLLLIVALTGCASSGEVRPTVWLSLTPAEQAQATRLEGAIAKVREYCLGGGKQVEGQCHSPSVVVVGNGGHAHYQNGHAIIVVPRILLSDHRVAHAVLAHELAHAWFPDARNDCQAAWKAVLCEQAANIRGVWVLQVGYGYAREIATGAVHSYLRQAVTRGAKPSQGDPDACAELHAFERWARLPLYACTERGN